jgi:Na+-translocating ferredoxin:NAD+ oxidoreductase RnfG subunit
MKHIKIIFTLSLVVLTASLSVFFVEGWATPIIDAENVRLANLAKFEVLPDLEPDDLFVSDGVLKEPENIDFSDSTINELFYFEGTGYIYTSEFKGYQSSVIYMIAIDMTGDISGFKVLVQGETPGYGAAILDEEYRAQFEGLALDTVIAGEIDDIAGLSGAPVTMGAFKASLKETIEYHQANYGGVVFETPEEREARLLLEAFPTAVRYEDITLTHEANDEIEIIYEVYDDGDSLLGYIYYVNTVGVSFTETTYIKFFVGFDLDKEITGFVLLDDNETTGKTPPMYLDDYGYSYIGEDINSDDYGIDEIAGSTMTDDLIQDVVREIATYHIDYVLFEGTVFVRPDDVEVTNENLLLAFPEGSTFTSVYQDYSYNELIGNVYEVFDAGNVLLGNVYYVEFDGRDNIIQLVLGIDVAGNTNLIEVLYAEESWSAASEYGTYDGLSGNFPDTTWLDFFEGTSVLNLILDPVDDVAGVSTTTRSLISAIDGVLQYHLFEVAGGAN